MYAPTVVDGFNAWCMPRQWLTVLPLSVCPDSGWLTSNRVMLLIRKTPALPAPVELHNYTLPYGGRLWKYGGCLWKNLASVFKKMASVSLPRAETLKNEYSCIFACINIHFQGVRCKKCNIKLLPSPTVQSRCKQVRKQEVSPLFFIGTHLLIVT